MENINHLAILAASSSILIIGGLWYSPALFYRIWRNESGISESELENQNQLKVYGIAFLIALAMCYNLSFFLADESTDWLWGTTAGLLTGFWAAGMLAVIALFENRSFRYVLINGGFIIIYFTLAGLVIGAWR